MYDATVTSRRVMDGETNMFPITIGLIKDLLFESIYVRFSNDDLSRLIQVVV